MIDLLIKMLPYVGPALRYADNPNRNPWRVDLLCFTFCAWVADMVLAHLYFAPQKGELTISDTLERTAWYDSDAMRLARAIDLQSPGHIKTLLRGKV